MKLLRESNDIKLGEVSNLKIMSIPSMRHYNWLIFIESNFKITFRTMVVRGMITFLKYDHPNLQEVLSQSLFTWRDNEPALSPKKLMQIVPSWN